MKKILTIIFDGFGIREEEHGNAILAAKMENFQKIWNNYSHTTLEASEESVGLTKGQFGNSEVGHSTIGAGRLVKQSETLVNEFLSNVDKENDSVLKLLSLKEKNVHIMGLCSDGNVHAGVDDFINMYEFLVNNDFKNIYFHLITDGRDTDEKSSLKYIKMISDVIKKKNIGEISTVCGRYFAMDRDTNWDRTKKYYDLIVNNVGTYSSDINISIKESYLNGITDEYIEPITLNKKEIKNGDVLIWMNYRADRSKQILSSLVRKNFSEFLVKDMTELTVFSMFKIDDKIKTNHFIEHEVINQPLGLYLSELGFTQARIAESEKFPHVTYFFDGGYDGDIKGCKKFNIPSPNVKTYDLKPEMNIVDVSKTAIKCMQEDYDFILVNFANSDMVGHTGSMLAATKACKAIDLCLGKLVLCAEENFYKVIVLADHGNSDIMITDDEKRCTTHTLSPVPFIIVDEKVKLKDGGSLVNVAPTILDYLDIAIPKDMKNTESLIIDK